MFEKLCLICSLFVEEKLGKQFVENRSIPFIKSYEETNTSTPVFFILSPGVDPIKDVEALGKKLGFTMNQKTFHNISLGQGKFKINKSSYSSFSLIFRSTSCG
jgi:dynein heavy chain